MGHSLTQIVVRLPGEEQESVEARYQDPKHEAEGFRELRRINGKAQAEVASALNIKQPSVSQIERQTDVYVSLCSYVEAVWELKLPVKLPNRPALYIDHLGDINPAFAAKPPAARQKIGASLPRRRHG